MKKLILLLTTLSIYANSFGYNPVNVVDFLSSRSCIGLECDLTFLDFGSTLGDIDAGSDSYAAMTSKYGTTTPLTTILNNHKDGSSAINLTGADLSGATLTGLNLEGANLSDATMVEVTMSGSGYLTSTDLSGANLSGSTIYGINAIGANLSGASLYQTVLDGSDFTSANFTKAGLGGISAKNTNFTKATLIELYTNMGYTNLKGQAINTPLDFRASTFLNTATFTSANLQGINLTSVDFSGAQMNQIQLEHTTLTNTNFTDAQMSGAALESANAAGANFTGVDFNDEANFNSATLTNANFTSAELQQADMQSANLTGATFSGADLTGVQFQDATLSNVIFNFDTRIDTTTTFDSNSSNSSTNNLNIMMNSWTSNSTLKANYNGSGASIIFYINAHMCYLGFEAACNFCPNIYPAVCYYYQSTNYSWRQIWKQIYPQGVSTYNDLVGSYNSRWGTSDATA